VFKLYKIDIGRWGDVGAKIHTVTASSRTAQYANLVLPKIRVRLKTKTEEYHPTRLKAKERQVELQLARYNMVRKMYNASKRRLKTVKEGLKKEQK
jgi:hypothetical protein